MRAFATAAFLLPALASAEQAQYPFIDKLTSIWDKVTPYLPGYVNPYNTTSPTNVARPKDIVTLDAKNWAPELDTHATEPWMILVTGGNVTCHGMCKRLDEVWTEASAVARTDSRAPNLGWIDCEKSRLLCATWGAVPATIWWVEPEVRTTKTAGTNAAKVTATEAEVEGEEPLDAKGIEQLSRGIHVVKLNTTTVDADDILGIYRHNEYQTKGELLDSESAFSRHPYNSQLARFGLNIPVGYVLFVLGMFPSWSMIMMLTFTMRMFFNSSAPKQTKAQREEEARRGKYTADGKVRGAPPGDGLSARGF